jgi:hypothetical protein
MMCREVIALYSDNHMKHTNTFYCQNSEILELSRHCSYSAFAPFRCLIHAVLLFPLCFNYISPCVILLLFNGAVSRSQYGAYITCMISKKLIGKDMEGSRLSLIEIPVPAFSWRKQREIST